MTFIRIRKVLAEVLDAVLFLGLLLVLAALVGSPIGTVAVAVPWLVARGLYVVAVLVAALSAGSTWLICDGLAQLRYRRIYRWVLREAARRGESLTECSAHTHARGATALGISAARSLWPVLGCQHSDVVVKAAPPKATP